MLHHLWVWCGPLPKRGLRQNVRANFPRAQHCGRSQITLSNCTALVSRNRTLIWLLYIFFLVVHDVNLALNLTLRDTGTVSFVHLLF